MIENPTQSIENKNLSIREEMKETLPHLLSHLAELKEIFSKSYTSTSQFTEALSLQWKKQEQDSQDSFANFLDQLKRLSSDDSIKKSRRHDIGERLAILQPLDAKNEILELEDALKLFEDIKKSIIPVFYWIKSLEFLLEPDISHNQQTSLQSFEDDMKKYFTEGKPEGTYKLSQRTDNKEIQVHFETTASEDIMLDIDAGSLFMIIMNCVRNASIHGNAKDIYITINSLNTGGISISLIDNGNGIDANTFDGDIKNIFKPGISGTGDSQRGIGLGDAEKKLKHFGAKIDVEGHHSIPLQNQNPESSGASFEIKIPLPDSDKSRLVKTSVKDILDEKLEEMTSH